MSNKIRVTFMSWTGEKHIDVSLDANLTADEVIYRLACMNFISSSCDYRLKVKRLQKTILPRQTLANVGVLEGDPIFVEPVHDSDNNQYLPPKRPEVLGKELEADLLKEYGGLTFDGASYRNWWHSILRNYGKYPCYGIFLLLPSDIYLMNYLTEFGNELNILSTHCLIIAPSPHGVKKTDFQLDMWKSSVNTYVRDGYGRFFSSLFKIPFSSYPCFAIFNDFQSADYALISLERLNPQEISNKLRAIFSLIDKAASTKEQPVKLIERSAKVEKLNAVGTQMIAEIKSLSKTTLETVFETLFKSLIP